MYVHTFISVKGKCFTQSINQQSDTNVQSNYWGVEMLLPPLTSIPAKLVS